MLQTESVQGTGSGVDSSDTVECADLEDVRRKILDSISGTCLKVHVEEYASILVSGKMLRAKLLLAVGKAADVEPTHLINAAAAVELLHTASLLHDDVIDGGVVRRNAPTFWKREGVPGAILLGDLLVCCSLKLVESGPVLSALIGLSAEMCDAEVEQELMTEQAGADLESCIKLAGRKSGALFAFVGPACHYGDKALDKALTAAGYAIGTAYQLADDIFDVYGERERSEKSLGTDARRGRVTAASLWEGAGRDPVDYIKGLCSSALKEVADWPDISMALDAYMNSEIFPAIETFLEAYERAHLDSRRGDQF